MAESLKNTVVLKQHHFTPGEAAIPVKARVKPANKHRGSLILDYKQEKLLRGLITAENDENKKGSQLDGFFLLEKTGSSFPEDVLRAELVDMNLRSVEPQDLSYFTNLKHLDVSENRLPLGPFGALPKLRELRLACNEMADLQGNMVGFQHLIYLDLSYNKLSVTNVQFLDFLPNLRDLDLSGNNLGGLPPEMFRFAALEKIILDFNQMEDGFVFQHLAGISNLRHVSLANNFLSIFPKNICADDNFKFLEILDVSFNYISQEEQLEPFIQLGRLLTLYLYGNPILGPTGEDPMYIYIEKLVEKAYTNRNGSNISDIEFLTEIPRKRTLKKGQPLGRHCLYREFDIRGVDINISTKSNKDWRNEGTQSLFAEAYLAIEQQKHMSFGVGSQGSIASLEQEPEVGGDFTFLTNMESNKASNNPYSNNEKVSQIDKQADDLMKQVAAEMGLINSDDVMSLARKARLPPTSQSLSQQVDGEDKVPHDLFRDGEISDPNVVPAQPVALATAMSALRRALKEPLTDYDAIYDSKQYTRDTKNSKQSKVPKHAFELSIAAGGSGSNLMDQDYAADRRATKFNRGGLPEPTQSRDLRKSSRKATLQRIDQVLDGLNLHTEQLVTNDPAANMTQRETLNAYSSFAKPVSKAISSLMTMVDQAADEFEDN